VLLLFGGFDLDPLLDVSWSKFERMMNEATDSGLSSEVDSLEGETFPPRRFRQIKQNLENYLSDNSG
jgi:hypothetical protein